VNQFEKIVDPCTANIKRTELITEHPVSVVTCREGLEDLEILYFSEYHPVLFELYRGE